MIIPMIIPLIKVRDEINSPNQNYEVLDVNKSFNSKTIKLTFLNSFMSENCLISRIKLFMHDYLPQDMKQKEYYEVNTC